jgi:alkanesulfonate monooxygenase SsuD/methylene tetrahydromethanopterin reductase-like flavin-dependent oxidoreductase (luciferase family)
MHFGATMWFTEYSISPAELAVTLEERGFESLWASEHSHLPVAGDPADGEMRKVQADVMDPFLTLTAAAMSTKTLRLGTGICLVNQRDPIQTAKLVAPIDQLSAGQSLIAPRLRARGFPAQQTEAAIGVAVLNRMLATGRPDSVRRQPVIA